VTNGVGVGCGIGGGQQGVAVQVAVHAGNPAIVVERPIYMIYGIQNGSGSMAGAHDVVGATGLAQQFGFAAASTLAGDDQYLTIENPGANPATVTIAYYGPNGQIGSTLSVSAAAHVRTTIRIWDPPALGGAGAGRSPLGVIITASRPVQVEKPTYSSNTATYGATDAAAYSPPSF
jgi:hypothetical protein